MSGGVIELEIADGVAIITLNNTRAQNALTEAMASGLHNVCDEIDGEKDVGAAIIKGAGNTFCSGADRSDLAKWSVDPAREDLYEETGHIYSAFVRVGALTVPTIAAVCGSAVGAGVNLMLATDLRVVATNARILGGFLAAGLHPGGGHFVLAGRSAGREATSAMALFGEEISGKRAVEVGMAWQHVDSEGVDRHSLELASRCAEDPELSRMTKATFRTALGPPVLSWEQCLEYERGRQMWSLRRRFAPRVDTLDPGDHQVPSPSIL